MARPKGSGMKGRTPVTTYVSAAEAQHIKRHAARDGHTPASWLRSLALEALEALTAREQAQTKD